MAGQSLDKTRAPIVDAEHGLAVFEALRSLLSRVRTRLDDRVIGPVRHTH